MTFIRFLSISYFMQVQESKMCPQTKIDNFSLQGYIKDSFITIIIFSDN
jgi:hypothetical protein